MQRPLFEWSGITFTFVALGSFVFWLVSLFSPVADFELSLGRSGDFQLVAGGGELLFCDSIANQEVIDLVDRGIVIEPPATADSAWKLPGLRFRRILFGQDGSSVWAIHLSCLIPFAIAAILATGCFLRLSTLRRKSLASRAASA